MALMDKMYRTFMRRNSVYIGFIIVGAFAGDKLVNSTADSLWESNNKGKLFKDLEKSLASTTE